MTKRSIGPFVVQCKRKKKTVLEVSVFIETIFKISCLNENTSPMRIFTHKQTKKNGYLVLIKKNIYFEKNTSFPAKSFPLQKFLLFISGY